MDNKLIYISNDDKQSFPSVDLNQWLKRLDTELIEANKKLR